MRSRGVGSGQPGMGLDAAPRDRLLRLGLRLLESSARGPLLDSIPPRPRSPHAPILAGASRGFDPLERSSGLLCCAAEFVECSAELACWVGSAAVD